MEVIYYIETKDEIFWSKRKLDVTFKHVQFLFRDRAKYREIGPMRFWENKKKSKKKYIAMGGD